MKINNLPIDYKRYEWIVVREVRGEKWFYDYWRGDLQSACEQADEVDGHVVNSAVAERT